MPLIRDPFRAFQASIGEIARCLGGAPHVWEAVAHAFDQALLERIALRTGESRHAVRTGAGYLRAEAADFSEAAAQCEALFGQVHEAPAIARGPWAGATLVWRVSGVWLEGEQASAAVVLVGQAQAVRDRKGWPVGQHWPVSLTEFGTRCLGGGAYTTARPTLVQARSPEEGTRRSRKLAEDFFLAGDRLAPVSRDKD